MTKNQALQEEKIPEQYGRVKGADWFPLLFKRPVMILGQGGIGSHLAFQISRIGCDLYLYDHDKFEDHNMTGQIVNRLALGKNKAVAVKGMLAELSPDCLVETFGKYTSASMSNDITLCGFDNMEARKVAFEKWKEYVESMNPDERNKCIFMDGRLLAEVMQIFTIPGDRSDLIEKYEKDYLFDDGSVQDANCTFKQTTHCGAMIASHMTGFLTNWAFNVGKKASIRQVPFYYEYMIPLNMTTIEK